MRAWAKIEKDTQQSNYFKRKQTGYTKDHDNKGNMKDWGNKPKTGQTAGSNFPMCGKNHGDKPCLVGQVGLVILTSDSRTGCGRIHSMILTCAHNRELPGVSFQNAR
ncbi:uncharacterized protein G2W53_027237 [Senna tora]|uniref:Uncharacterized protein n=1 Tax=Senna tora TaxID=362788 RepID=A0A834WGD4_9FABA|nr:uncharacterized protein G2W53_027237 [Senna tora]